MNKAIFNWSGGKDSSLTLYHVLKNKTHNIHSLLTSVNGQYNRVSMHGVRVQLLKRQAEEIGLPLHQLVVPEMPTMEAYNNSMCETLNVFKEAGVTQSIFGDIFLEDLKKYREDQLAKVGMTGVFPIWKRPTDELAREFIDLGFKTVLVCVNDRYLDKSFAGREFDEQLLKDFPKNVDPCGENGEFHSFVYDGPIFKNPIRCERGDIVYKKYKPAAKQDNDVCPSDDSDVFNTGFWYCDLLEKK